MAYYTNEACNLQVDYSEVAGARILPFLISLNLADSLLSPAAGENQRFCYDIEGVGEDNSTFADLRHLVLGICNEITAAEVAGVTVTINGEEQEVVFGEDGNVELRSEEAPDPPTGCPGLKFDFPLDKVDGTMQLCFKLTDPRAVGPITVCLYGGGVTADSLTICGPICRQDEDDTVVAYHRSAVSVPVSVTHFAVAGTPLVTRCGAPEIIMGGSPAGSCGFTIRQQMCVALPMEFGAMVETGTPTTECLGAGGRPCACCGDDGEEEEGIISRPIHC